MKTVFLRALEADDKAAALRDIIGNADVEAERRWFEVDPLRFADVPRSPFGYWVSSRVRNAFVRLPPFQSGVRTAQFGPSTKNDPRYLRLCWEVRSSQIASTRAETEVRGWARLLKGGAFSPHYADPHLLIGWRDDGVELKTDISEYRGSRGWGFQWSAALNGHDHYFRAGLSWPRRTNGLSFRVMPKGCIFADKGPAAFVVGDSPVTLLALSALTNSAPFGLLVSVQLARTELAQSYEVGLVARTPVPDLSRADEEALAALARRAWSLKRGLDTRTETSHAYVLPALLQMDGETLAARSAAWSEHVRVVEDELAAIQAEIDDRCFELYGIDEDDRQAISDGFGGITDGLEVSEGQPGEDAETEDEAAAVAAADAGTLAAELVAWAIGVAFGRFDIRLATGARAMPPEPGPFDPLPVCSPAMLTGDDGLPFARPTAGYALSFPEDGILVDDPGHPRDLTGAVRAVFETVFGPRADAVWQEAAALLDPRGHDLRNWLASGFFELHLRRHSKSRRKAPILWQLGIPSGRYSVWCYAHRLSRDSLFAVQNDVVAPKLAHEERRLSSLVTQAGPAPSARDRAEIASQEVVVDELRVLLDDVRRVAPLWNPNLDDGFVLVLAPLWRLVPGHRAWQKELNSRWDELLAGKYDWAHLAMHLWPERVVLECSTDRSFAIAHGLEDVFWVEGSDGKWTRRTNPTQPIDDLVLERTSPAIKAALASLLQAPGPLAGVGRQTRNAGVTA
jgi:hypothetical protein